MTAAWTHPVEFVRVVASLVPRELEATTTVHMERMSDAQLIVHQQSLFALVASLNVSSTQLPVRKTC